MENKSGLTPRLEKGSHFAREDLKPEKSFVLYSGDDRYPLGEDTEAIGLRELAAILAGGVLSG